MADLILRIADFNISLKNETEFPIQLEEGYTDFVVSEIDANPDVTVNVKNGIPADKKVLNNPIYSANFNGSELWKIARIEDGLRFHIFSPDPPFALQQVATLNAEMTVWHIYTEPQETDGERNVSPLLYPMGPLVMYYLTARHDAIMIHGSGVSDDGNGKIFTGVSGQGKTTMAKLWFESGAEVLNDDRLIIRKETTGYRIYNTPMFYQDGPRSVRLKSIYSIHHSKSNTLNVLTDAAAVTAISPNLIQHGYSSKLISHHLNFVSEMIKKVTVCKLGFVPDQRVIQEIKNHDHPSAGHA